LGLVLGQDIDLVYFGIYQIAEDEIDEAIHPSERDGGFGALLGQGVEAFPLSPGEHHS
jgi:hypothetical protein